MWDYIVVGGGSAGCVIASRLSENPRHSVLLLNAGRGFLERTSFVAAPAASLYIWCHDWFSWKYKKQPDPSANNREDLTYCGKILGGGSSVNGMMFIRGGAHDYDEWAAAGNAGWSYKDVLPYFKKMERTRLGSDEYHGRHGPLGVDSPAPMLDISHRFIESAIEVGIPYNPDINGETLEGVTRTPCSIYGGIRQSTATVYLKPALKRLNLKVVTQAVVRRILFEGKRAVAVEYERLGQHYVARAGKEIILSAGAVRSPQILLLSGVGDSEQLSQFKLPVIQELPGVGRNYMDHSALHMLYAVKLPTWSRDLPLKRQAMHGLRWLASKSGPAQAGASQAVAFVRTHPGLEHPDIQITLLPFGDSARLDAAELDGCDLLMVYVSECKPVGRGQLRLASTDIKQYPLISFGMFDGKNTLAAVLKGVEIVRRIMSASAISPHVAAEMFPGREVRTQESLENAIRASAVSMAHPSGTCRMGNDDAAVVDHQLKVKGIGGLRVADASIMPTIPSGNINAPVVMIGEKAAELIQQELSSPSVPDRFRATRATNIGLKR